MSTSQTTTFKELTTSERNALTPPTFTLVFDTDLSQWFVWNGSSWVSSTSSLSVGTYDSQSAVADGLQIISSVLYAQSADATHPGMMSTGTQTIAGAKTFSGALSGSSTLDITGAATFHSTGNFTSTLTASNLSGTNTGNVTIGTANGLSVSGQALSLAAATTSVTGALTSTDWNTFNGKQAAGNYITALTGDVTASGPGSAAATLAATSNGTLVTLSALTTASALASVGTITTGVWSATAVGATKGGTAQTSWTTGDLLYASGTNTLSKLAIGTAGQVLTVASGLPSWGTNVGNLSVVTKTANYSATTADDAILCSAGTAFAVTLPTSVGNTGKQFYIKKTDSSANAVTINTTSSQTIDGVTSTTLTVQYQAIWVVSDGANWQTFHPALNAAALIGTTLASNVVTSSLTTVGTIGTGVWNGTAVDVAHGGTGAASFTAYSVICGGTTSTGAFQNVSGVGSSGQVLTSNGASALPTWQASASGATGSYSQAYFASASSWGTTSATFVDGTNSGGNSLTVRQSSGITLTAGGSNVCGITFTPANSSAIYLITAQVGIFNSLGGGQAACRMTDGTTVIALSPGWTQGAVANGTTIPLIGIFVPGTGSAVTVKIQQAALNAGTTTLGSPFGNVATANAVEWTVVRIA